MFIYKITNTVNQKLYIGQTIRDVNLRFNEHLSDKTSTDYFHTSVRKYVEKYGKDIFTVEIIDTASSVEELNEKEIFWIDYYRSFVGFSDSRGYNSSLGGTDNPMFNEVVKSKHDNKMRSDDVRQRISETMKRKAAAGELFSEEHRRNLSVAMAGNKHFLGHKRTPEAIEATARGRRKKVKCVDVSGNVVAKFDSLTSACNWWYPEYVKVRKCKKPYNLADVIKLSSDQDSFILGLKWMYE